MAPEKRDVIMVRNEMGKNILLISARSKNCFIHWTVSSDMPSDLGCLLCDVTTVTSSSVDTFLTTTPLFLGLDGSTRLTRLSVRANEWAAL